MAEDWRAVVVGATVRLPTMGGQGVLVPGGFILTAAHCIEQREGESLFLGDRHIETVTTSDGRSFYAELLAVDAVADIAVLGPADDDADAFEEWAEATAPVSLSGGFADWCPGGEPGAKQAFGLHCWTHEEGWVAGRALRTLSLHRAAAGTWAEFSEPIRSGTSGGPIVDPAGRLVGVVSFTNEVAAGTCAGRQPLAAYALPRWVLARIEEANA